MSRKILDVKGVNKSFGGLKALNEVVFDAVERDPRYHWPEWSG